MESRRCSEKFAWCRAVAVAVTLTSLALASCSSTESDSGGPPKTTSVEDAVPVSGSCDEMDHATCLMPWPNDRFTRPDDATPTGMRIDLPIDGAPVNVSDKPIAVDQWNLNDGFSPSAIPMTVIPNVDVDGSELAPVTDMARSLDPDGPLVLLDVTAGERLMAWAELDSNNTDPAESPLMIVPAKALVEGHEHVVALRNLVDTEGGQIDQNGEYTARLAHPDHFTSVVIAGLEDNGFDPEEMTLAWSFTVASGESLSGRLRHMWAESKANLGEGAPTFEIEASTTDGGVTTVEGTFETPNYLVSGGEVGATMNNQGEADGIPTQNGSLASEFTCLLPAEATESVPVVLYGHGLLGSRSEVRSIGTLGASAGIAFCALDWIGMSSADIPTVVEALSDLSGFGAIPDRMQQGHLGWLTFGRLIASDEGLATSEAFQNSDSEPILDGERIAFLGASQGGILGGVPSALSDDWTKVVLAVPGMGYNLLLPRSIDFDEFAPAFTAAYPEPIEQAVARELMQMLWDRGENSGWAQHLTTDPYDDAPAKDVLLLEAFGDHQVANVSTEKLARTLEVGRVAPTLQAGRSADVDPFVGIDPIDQLPHDGSALLVWDFGTPAPPTDNVAPREGDDPHGDLGDEARALSMVIAFIAPDGKVVDVCGGVACTTP